MSLISDTSRQLARAGTRAGSGRCQGNRAPGPLFQRRVRQRGRNLHGAHPAGDRKESGGGRPAILRRIADLAAAGISEAAGGSRKPNRLNFSTRLSLRPRKARRRAWIRAAARPRRPRYPRRAGLRSAARDFPVIHSVSADPAAIDAVQPRVRYRASATRSDSNRADKPQNIAASRIGHLHRDRRGIQIAHIAGIRENAPAGVPSTCFTSPFYSLYPSKQMLHGE